MSTTSHLFEDIDGAPYPEEVQVKAREMYEELTEGYPMGDRDSGYAIDLVMELLVAVDRAVRKQIEEDKSKLPPGTVTFKNVPNPTASQRVGYTAYVGMDRDLDFNDVIAHFRRLRDRHGEEKAIAFFLTIGYVVTVAR